MSALVATLWVPTSVRAEESVQAAAAEVTDVSLSLLGSHDLAAPGWDGQTKPRGNNGDLAVLDNANGRTAFVAAGPRFHGLWSVTAGRVCTDHGGVKIVDLANLATPAGIINVEDFKGVVSGPTGNPRRGLELTNISSAASSVDAMTFTEGSHAGKDILAIATQRCEQSFFNGARIEFWDVTNRAAPTKVADFNPENILNPANPAQNGQWGIFEEVRMFSRVVSGVTKHYALATTPFSIGNAHDASFAGDMRVLDITDLNASDTAMQVSTFPNGTVGSVQDNGCRTFHSGRSVAPTPNGNGAILSWYDGVPPSAGTLGSTNTAAVFNLDLNNMPVVSGTALPKTFSPVPPNWGYPVGALAGEDGVVEGNAADVEPFTGPGGKLMTFVSEDDNDPALTDFSVTAPASLAATAPVNDRACSMMIGKRTHQLPNQELVDDAVYVGRACPASALINSALPADDPLLADVSGKVAIVESGGDGFNQCGATDKIRRLFQAGATGVLMNLGGDFLSVHIPGIDGDFPAIPAVGIQSSAWNKLGGLVPGARLLAANTTFPTSWARSTTTNVTQRPFALAVSAATNASPIVLTTPAHGLSTGDRVVVAGVGGNTAANGVFTVTVNSTTTLALDGSVGSGAYTGGGSAIPCPANVGLSCPTGHSRRTDFGRFRSVANGTDPVARAEVAAANRFNVTAGDSYRAGASLEVEEVTTGSYRAAVVWYDANGVAISESEIESLSAPTARTQYAETVTAPVGAVKGAVKAEWTGAGAAGIGYADTFFMTSAGIQIKLKDHAGECAGGTRTYWPPGNCAGGTVKPEWGQQRILDFSLSTPAQAGTYRSPNSLVWPPPDEGIYAPSQARMFGSNLAFTAWHSDGLRVVDVSNPANPREVAQYVPPAVVDPSGAAGPSNRALPGSGTCDLATDAEPAANVPCMTRNKSFPTVPLVTAVEVIPSATNPNAGTVVVSDINAGLYVLSFTVNKRANETVDFDGDGDSDISVFRPGGGAWFSNSGMSTSYGQSGDIPLPNDFDGDGTTDKAIYRPSTGLWAISRSTDGTDTLLTYGVSTDIPVPGDYDGDGKADVGVFRESQSTWYYRSSSTNADTILTFGIPGDIPVIGDYDGDGRDDIAVFRPSDGSWFVNKSSGGLLSLGYGQNGDVPIPGDYDGDAKTDIAIFRPSVGLWAIHRSSDNGDTLQTYGVNIDQVQPADYDGDGKTDIAVFRPSVSTWYIRRSSDFVDQIVTFGLGTDIPLSLPNYIRRQFYTP